MVDYHYRTRRVFWGILYLLIGLAFVVDSSGAFKVSATDIWPLVLVSFGAATLLNRARRLQVEEDRSEQLAVAEERVRIARELHDIVAHGVSLMTIQIAAARRVAASKPEASDQSLTAAEQTGRQTLSELDNLLAVLRGADASIGAAAAPGQPAPAALIDGADPRQPLPRLTDIPALITGLKDAGRQVALEVLGDQPTLPPSVQLVLYRVVQEALTNAVRYAGDSPIEVQLIYTPEQVSAFIDDEGPGAAAQSRPGGGHGIVGMAERLATVGGTITAGPRQPGPGWRVHATIPVLALVA